MGQSSSQGERSRHCMQEISHKCFEPWSEDEERKFNNSKTIHYNCLGDHSSTCGGLGVEKRVQLIRPGHVCRRLLWAYVCCGFHKLWTWSIPELLLFYVIFLFFRSAFRQTQRELILLFLLLLPQKSWRTRPCSADRWCRTKGSLVEHKQSIVKLRRVKATHSNITMWWSCHCRTVRRTDCHAVIS